jgi:hypothetical protein
VPTGTFLAIPLFHMNSFSSSSPSVTVHWTGVCKEWIFVYVSLHAPPSAADIKWLKTHPSHWITLVVCESGVKRKTAYKELRTARTNVAVWSGHKLWFDGVSELLGSETGPVGPQHIINRIFKLYDVMREEDDELSIITKTDKSDTGNAGSRVDVASENKAEASQGYSLEFLDECPVEKELFKIFLSQYTLSTAVKYVTRLRVFCKFAQAEEKLQLSDVRAMSEMNRNGLLEKYLNRKGEGKDRRLIVRLVNELCKAKKESKIDSV